MTIKVVLDAGHGGSGSTAGKRTPDGEYEWNFNNKVANYCNERLKQYGKFETLRVDDTTGKKDIPLKTRTDKANSWNANVYASIHQNALNSKWGVHGGTETFYNTNSSNSKKLAQNVQNELVGALKLRNRGIKSGNHLHVINSTPKMISILSEASFMDSTTDIKVLRSNELLKAQGYAIADGIAKYYGFTLPKSPAPSTSINKSITDMKTSDLTFTSSTLKNELNSNLNKLKVHKIIDSLATTELKHSSKLKHNKLEDGDLLSIALLLALSID